MVCGLCGAENPVDSGHCRRSTVEEFFAFMSELRVVPTPKPYPEKIVRDVPKTVKKFGNWSCLRGFSITTDQAICFA
jgi:hypothetical protein